MAAKPKLPKAKLGVVELLPLAPPSPLPNPKAGLLPGAALEEAPKAENYDVAFVLTLPNADV